ncbi:MAG: FecR domain-containing protein, partial [Xanthobacteraceae bacterium]
MAVLHPDSSSPFVVVPDAHLLLSAHFSRSGPDLLLTGDHGGHYVVPGYFSSEHPPALGTPNGVKLSADIVGLLAGSPTPGEYAQAQPTPPTDGIGKVEKVVGSVSVIRNGVAVTLNVGDAVYKNDVIETGADSKVGVGFPDGTALQLLANTRMALNDYSYDPNGHSNTALFTYVTGTFGFFAGKVAHTGDMKIDTPIATMGIRGTTGVMGQGTDPNGHLFFWQSLYDDPGTTVSGSWDDFVRSANGTLSVATTLSQTEFMTVFTLEGPGLPPQISTIPIPSAYAAIGQQLVEELAEVINLLNVNPHSLPGSPGSPGSPFETPPSNVNPNNDNPQLLLNVPPDNHGGPPITVTDLYLPPPPPHIVLTSNLFIWNSGPASDPWVTPIDWNQGSPPPPGSNIEIQSGTSQYDLTLTVNDLTVDPGAILDVTGGSLMVLGTLTIDPGGIIEFGPSSSDPVLTFDGPVDNDGVLQANGPLSELDFVGNQVLNFGTIAAEQGGNVEFRLATVTNEAGDSDSATPPGKILSVGAGSVVAFTDVIVDNAGFVAAKDCGGISLVNAAVTNKAGALILAADYGTITLSLSDATTPIGIPGLTNYGAIDAESGGSIAVATAVTNDGGTFEAKDFGGITFDTPSGVVNEDGGRIEARDHGTVTFDNT